MVITEQDIGNTVLLKGKSRHGKNRIQQHGKKWSVCQIRQNRMLLKSLERTDKGIHDLRWIEIQDDPNFVVDEKLTDNELDLALLKMEHMEIMTGRF